jgi:asparagine synthase (glutamine-hydrolysing)
LSPDLRHSLKGYSPADLFKDLMAASETADPVSRAQYVDIKTFLADDILVKVDRASMAVGLEARDPMLDHVLVETAATIPSRLKLAGRCGKLILKKAAADRVPEEILARPKQGFEAPIGDWLRGTFREFAHATLFASNTPCEGQVDLITVRDLWCEHQSGARNHAPHLWAVLMFSLWAERFARAD